MPQRGPTISGKPFEYHRRFRVFFIDGVIYPATCHMDVGWNVHSSSREQVMRSRDWMQDEEAAFVADYRAFVGATASRALQSIIDAVGLDFCGIDFNLLPDGRILIYEVNPIMRHSFDYVAAFPYLRPGLEKISAAFEKMVLRRAQGRAAT